MTWLSENYKWLFDGIGALVVMAVLGYVVRRILQDRQNGTAALTAQGAKVMNSPVASGFGITQTINSPTINLSVPAPTVEEAARKRREAQEQREARIRTRLAQFLKEGQDIQQKWEYSNLNAPYEKKEWENRVEAYVAEELDESYAIRFRAPTLQIVSFPADINPKMQGQWGDTTAKMAMLNDFISELRFRSE
jgi:hypothetical protein